TGRGAAGAAALGLTLLGSGWAALALLPLLRHPRTRRFAAWLSLAILVQAALVWAIKLGVGRVRPWIAFGLPPPLGAPHDYSFPSGHAAGSFCVAAFLALGLPGGPPRRRTWRRAVMGVLVTCLAFLVALSRVYLGAHFPTDVAAGSLLGACVGGAFGRLHGGRSRRAPEPASRCRRRPDRGPVTGCCGEKRLREGSRLANRLPAPLPARARVRRPGMVELPGFERQQRGAGRLRVGVARAHRRRVEGPPPRRCGHERDDAARATRVERPRHRALRAVSERAGLDRAVHPGEALVRLVRARGEVGRERRAKRRLRRAGAPGVQGALRPGIGARHPDRRLADEGPRRRPGHDRRARRLRVPALQGGGAGHRRGDGRTPR
ncbi:MAG: phosphatase PAP2 family protein, partial [Myxococcales bacterium]|nr:phosphatase PAP2 family protein [Myxococcales bacterium]